MEDGTQQLDILKLDVNWLPVVSLEVDKLFKLEQHSLV